jgi:hypothetical protein
MKKREKEEKDRRVVCLTIDPRIYIYKVCIQLHKYPNNNTSSFFHYTSLENDKR